MKTYECKVTITETHYIYVDADTKDKAKEYAKSEAMSNTPDELVSFVKIISEEDLDD